MRISFSTKKTLLVTLLAFISLTFAQNAFAQNSGTQILSLTSADKTSEQKKLSSIAVLPDNIDFWSDYPNDLLADTLVNRMSDEELLSQILMFGWAGQEPSDLLNQWVSNRGLGSVKVFGWNTDNINLVAKSIRSLQQKSQARNFKIPLFVATDQEGGWIRHVKGDTSDTPGNMAIGAGGYPIDAYYSGFYINREIRALGINMNFAPTVDLYTNLNSTVIGPRSFGSDAESDSIDELISIAQQKRPDLLRAAANKDAAWHRRNSSLLTFMPSVSASASMGWDKHARTGIGAPEADTPNGTIGISISMPIFTGFSNFYFARSAAASYEAAKESERNVSNNAMMDVFTAYQNYKTARTVLSQTETLLKSATESERVTSGMYKVGRATMLDWQTAQSELINARKQNNSAKYDLFIKRAAVALAIGDIKSELEGMRNEEQ